MAASLNALSMRLDRSPYAGWRSWSSGSDCASWSGALISFYGTVAIVAMIQPCLPTI